MDNQGQLCGIVKEAKYSNGSYRFGQMDNQGRLCGIVKEVKYSNGKGQVCIYFYRNGKPEGGQICDENGKLTNNWKLIDNNSKDGKIATLREIIYNPSVRTLATYSKNKKTATLHYNNGSTVEVELLEGTDGEINTEHPVMMSSVNHGKIEVKLEKDGKINTEYPTIKSNADGTKTRYVLDQDGEILREINIPEHGTRGTLYRKDVKFEVKLKDGTRDTLHGQGVTFEVELLEGTDGEINTEHPAIMHSPDGDKWLVKLSKDGDILENEKINTEHPTIISNADGTKTRYVTDQDGKILREIKISKDGKTGTLRRENATFEVKLLENGDIDTRDPVTMDSHDGDKWLFKLSQDGDILEISDRITRSDDGSKQSKQRIAKFLKKISHSENGSGQWLVTLSEKVNTSAILEKITRSDDKTKGTMIDEKGNELRFELLENGEIDTKSKAIITPKNPENPEFPDSYISYIRFHRVVSTINQSIN